MLKKQSPPLLPHNGFTAYTSLVLFHYSLKTKKVKCFLMANCHLHVKQQAKSNECMIVTLFPANRIVVFGKRMNDAVVPGSAKPFDFKRAYRLNYDTVRHLILKTFNSTWQCLRANIALHRCLPCFSTCRLDPSVTTTPWRWSFGTINVWRIIEKSFIFTLRTCLEVR